MNICQETVATKKIKSFAKTFFVLFPAALLLAVGACDLLTSNNNNDNDNISAVKFDLNEGEWDSAHVFKAIESVPDGDTAKFSGNLTEKVIKNIGDAVKNRKKKIALDLSNCTELKTIPDYVFYECNKVTAITIPSSVTSIGNSAFSGCQYIESITIPNSVTSIDTAAFSNCKSLTTLIIGDGVTKIKAFGFFDCKNLTTVIIGNKVTKIEGLVFKGCESLTAITVNPDNVNYKDINGVLFSKDGKTLICYPANKKETSYEIPSDVKNIADCAFYKCTNLTSISIPSSVTNFGTDAFEGCNANLGNLYERFICGSGYWEIYSAYGNTECVLARSECCTAWLIIGFLSDTSFQGHYGYVHGLRDEQSYNSYNGKFSIKENKISITRDGQTEPFVTYFISISNNRLKFSVDENDKYDGVYFFRPYDGSIPPQGWFRDYSDYLD